MIRIAWLHGAKGKINIFHLCGVQKSLAAYNKILYSLQKAQKGDTKYQAYRMSLVLVGCKDDTRINALVIIFQELWRVTHKFPATLQLLIKYLQRCKNVS